MTKVAVIAGWERSGSTILANVLGSAPGVVTVGEINNIWERGFGRDLVCACGARFSRCPMWKPIADRAFGPDLPSVAERAAAAIEPMGNTWLIRRRLPLTGPAVRDRGEPYATLLDPLYRAATEETGAGMLIDASKSPWHAAVAYELAGHEVFVIHLVRDPRGVAHSLGKKIRYDTDDERSIYMDRHGVGKSSAAWVYRARLIESTWKTKPRFTFLRYEDFVASPRRVIASLLSWIGWEGGGPRFHGENQVEIEISHNISGNPVRFHQGTVALRPDEAWRTGLSSARQRYVRLLTWPHMRHFGYQP